MTPTRLLPKSEQDSKEETLALAWARVASLQGSAESLQYSRGCCAWPGALLAGEMPTGLSWPVAQLLTSAQLNIRQRLVWYPSLEMPSWSCLDLLHPHPIPGVHGWAAPAQGLCLPAAEVLGLAGLPLCKRGKHLFVIQQVMNLFLEKKNHPFLHGYKHASESQLPSPSLKFGQSTVDDSHLILFFFPSQHG